MPAVKRGEKRNEYVPRCVKEVMGEGKKQNQAVGQCEGMFDSKWKGPLAPRNGKRK